MILVLFIIFFFNFPYTVTYGVVQGLTSPWTTYVITEKIGGSTLTCGQQCADLLRRQHRI